MDRKEFLLHHASRVVAVYKKLERDLGRPPTFAEFQVAQHADPEHPGESLLMLRELWEAIIIPELASILQRFSPEIFADKVNQAKREAGLP